MTTGPHPSAAELDAAIAAASRAPSIHNTQPWRWRVTAQDLELFADPSRGLHAADPAGRLMMISCGAVLDHFRVAAEAAGWRSHVTRFPDPAEPTHVASLTFERADPSEAVSQLAAAVADRRSDRRPMSSWPVPSAYADRLVAVATRRGALAHPLTFDEVDRWAHLATQAAEVTAGPEYQAELFEWTHRSESSHDGVPATNRLADHERGAFGVNAFPPGDVTTTPESGDEPPHPLAFLIGTSSDDSLARLRAGEALSAVLLEATRAGLATSIDTQVLEVGPTRRLVENELLAGYQTPQVLVTVGWPSTADPLPNTPRRGVEEIVTSTVDSDVLSDQH